MNFIFDISVEDYQSLHIEQGWKYIRNDLVKEALKNSMFKISAQENGKTIGIARIISDGATKGLLSDVIVLPEYQGKGIGTQMVKTLMDKVQEFVNNGRDEFLVELLPTTDKESFYINCGFKHKPENMAGVYKWFKNQNLYSDNSKKYYLHLDAAYFASVKAKTKTIEVRVMDEKRQRLKTGDYIIFINRGNPDERVCTKIIALHTFTDFNELYNAFDKVVLGYQQNEAADPLDMAQFYSKEEIIKYGVVGIEIEVVNNG